MSEIPSFSPESAAHNIEHIESNMSLISAALKDKHRDVHGLSDSGHALPELGFVNWVRSFDTQSGEESLQVWLSQQLVPHGPVGTEISCRYVFADLADEEVLVLADTPDAFTVSSPDIGMYRFRVTPEGYQVENPPASEEFGPDLSEVDADSLAAYEGFTAQALEATRAWLV